MLRPDSRGAGVREVTTMAVPAVIRMASIAVMGFVDALMVAKVRKEDMAAVSPAGLAFFTILVLIEGLASTNNTFVSQSFGARRFRDCARFTWYALYVSLALGLLVQLIHPFAQDLFALMPHQRAVQTREVVYFRIRLYGAVSIAFVVALSSFFQGISRPRIPMIVGVAANGLNVGLNYVLIYGRLGLPRMEIGGAALGTVIATSVQAFVLFLLFLGPRMHRPCLPDFRKLAQFLRIGVPVGLHWMLDVGTWAVFVTFIVGMFGTDQLAGSNIVGQYLRLSWLPTIGLNHAATQLMGQWIGRGRPDIGRQRALTALAFGMVYMAIMGAVFLLLRRSLMLVFLADEDVVRCGATIMLWAVLFQVFDAIGIVLYGALKGAGDTLVPAVMMVASGWLVFIPSAFLFSKVLGYEAPGAWVGAALHIAVVAGLMYWRFRSGRWQRIQLIQPAVARETAAVRPPDMGV